MAPRARVPEELTHGPFTLEEALRAGLSRHQLAGASWRRLCPGWYAYAGLGTGPEIVLAAIRRRLPPETAFSGLTAAWLRGLDVRPDNPIEATVPDRWGISGRAGVRLRRAALAEADIGERHGLPVTSGVRTAFDLARHLSLVEAVVHVDMALHAGITTPAELCAYSAERSGARGIARARRVIDLMDPASESPMESRLRLVLVLNGLPRPQAQVSIHDDRGQFLGRLDLYYPSQRVGIEYDGGNHRDRLAEDDRRQNLLVGAGIHLLRFTNDDVKKTPGATIHQVRTALQRRLPEDASIRTV